jgi:Leucine-rich repeat (LRR) protein
MRLIVKFILFIFPIILVQCNKDEPITLVTISDGNLLNALIERGVDTKGDSIISSAEVEAVSNLDVSCCNTSDMTGIEEFVNIDTLNCFNNQLTILDVTNSIALKWLYCSGNQLTSLDISNNNALKYLY